MAKFTSDLLDEYSRLMVGHQEWGFLDKLPSPEQLNVIKNYCDREQYIVVVFKRNDLSKKHYDNRVELGIIDEENKEKVSWQKEEENVV